MKCPVCQFENSEEAKFCGNCGKKISLICSHCGCENTLGNNFCNECGQALEDVAVEETKTAPETESERKYVTVLFSDLSGYTSITERLDPEEVKEIMSRIFAEIAQIITKFEGFIERFVGDAVMAIFGVPKTHEDDPVRAVKAAVEIHSLVKQLSPKLKDRTGVDLSMHSGINTGLVVTGEVKLDQGTHGLTGDAINTAARLQGLAKTGDILVGYETYRRTEGFFDYEELETAKLKGKDNPVQVYRMISPRYRPVTVHRLSGMSADLIGRKSELNLLREALKDLKGGKKSIFSICGDAGTGKSRLAEDFRAELVPEEFQLLEGHAYPHAQNIPYFPLINFFNGVFSIEEADPPEKFKEKIHSRINSLLGETEHIVPFIGSLYSLSHPDLNNVSPDLWRYRIQEGVKAILSGLCASTPTILFFEDLHWADSSFLELLRYITFEIRTPIFMLCTYRPPFTLFTSDQLGSLSSSYNEIRLQELSPSEAHDMVCSLLRTDTLPLVLGQFVQDKAEGNPFYLEEVINSLIESGTLVRDKDDWCLTKRITELEISSSIHGVILARLDRLEKEEKQILQEASVIGRAFLYDILKTITNKKEQIDKSLKGLEQLDLIRTRSLHPDLEYVFKHVLTQETAYNGLLKKERKEIHERIGVVMERLFQKRLPEFYETLALHFKRGKSKNKAIEYLVKAGWKSFSRYALEESHQYYKEAFDLLSKKAQKTQEDKKIMIKLIIKWGSTLHLKADFVTLSDLFKKNEKLVESNASREHLVMFYGWLGFALGRRELLKEGYQYLCKALQLAEEMGDVKATGYTCAWLSHTCADWDLLDEAVIFGERARAIANRLEMDQYLFGIAYLFSAYTHYFKGDVKKTAEIGKSLFDYSRKHNDPRSLAFYYLAMGMSRTSAGDLTSAIGFFEKGIKISPDPMTSHVLKTFLGRCYIAMGRMKEAQSTLTEVIEHSGKYGYEIAGTVSKAFKGMVLIAQGNLKEGIALYDNAMQKFLEGKQLLHYAAGNYLMGMVYSKLAQGRGERKDFFFILRNILFLVKTLPFAQKKAEKHLTIAIKTAKEIGAKSLLGQARLELGKLHKAKGRPEKARECILNAIEAFEKCEADVFLGQARESFSSL